MVPETLTTISLAVPASCLAAWAAHKYLIPHTRLATIIVTTGTLTGLAAWWKPAAALPLTAYLLYVIVNSAEDYHSRKVEWKPYLTTLTLTWVTFTGWCLHNNQPQLIGWAALMSVLAAATLESSHLLFWAATKRTGVGGGDSLLALTFGVPIMLADGTSTHFVAAFLTAFLTASCAGLITKTQSKTKVKEISVPFGPYLTSGPIIWWVITDLWN